MSGYSDKASSFSEVSRVRRSACGFGSNSHLLEHLPYSLAADIYSVLFAKSRNITKAERGVLGCQLPDKGVFGLTLMPRTSRFLYRLRHDTTEVQAYS